MELHIFLLILTIWSSPVFGWDSVEMEVFDVVEEVNQNFYELMGISPNAELTDIKKAYRTLSKQIHPDKSDAPDADIKFRQMVAVYEVLKDPERRAHYDKVLVDGLPDWRSAVYYYRRARKMSMLEITFILIVVISISQYLMAWGTYFDQWKTLDDVISRKFKGRSKNKKRSEEGDILEEALASIPKPSMWNVLPIQLVRGIYYYTMNGPRLYREHKEEQKRRKEEEEQAAREEEEERMLWEKEEEERKARKAAPKRRRVVPEPAPSTRRKGLGETLLQAEPAMENEPAAMGYNTGMWTHDELCDLTKLMNKHPGGTVDRWDVIAEQLNRAPQEVTKMAAKMKDKIAAGTWLADQDETTQTKIKTKTRAVAGPGEEESQSGDEHWSAVQQRALERALKMLPKGTDQRWEKIAKQVPEKTAEDCINRFKFLAEKIRKKKEEENAAKNADGGGEDATEGKNRDEDGGEESPEAQDTDEESEEEEDEDAPAEESDAIDISCKKRRVNKKK